MVIFRVAAISLWGALAALVEPSSDQTPCMRLWEVQAESRVVVSGCTNVNQFSCAAAYPGYEQILSEVCVEAGFTEFKGGIRLEVEDFECGNAVMNRDFAKTLKADEYGGISLTLLGLQGEVESERRADLIGEVEVTLAGTTHRTVMKCELDDLEDGKRRIRGSHSLAFSDFDMHPPRRLLGAVRVEDQIQVDFTLIIEKVE